MGAKVTDELAKFHAMYEPVTESGCWLWTRATRNKGYGVAWYGGKLWVASRLSWTIHFGDVPDGLFVCHKCDTPSCVNPAHLFVGTATHNMRDMTGKGRHCKQAVTHCPKGHPYIGENLKISTKGSRLCAICRNTHTREFMRAKRAREK